MVSENEEKDENTEVCGRDRKKVIKCEDTEEDTQGKEGSMAAREEEGSIAEEREENMAERGEGNTEEKNTGVERERNTE